MTVRLPTYDPVVFASPPLEEVVCQLQFAPILRITTAAPAEFQDQLRDQYPLLGQEHGVQLAVFGGRAIAPTSTATVWLFQSADERWAVSLSAAFVALKTSAYKDFDDFSRRLQPVIDSFRKIYAPRSFTRVGLRYVNRWVVPRTGGQPVPWGDLLNPVLSGLYADPVLSHGLAEDHHQLVLQGEYGQIGCRYAREVGVVEEDKTTAERFTLDFDHFAAGETACDGVPDLLAHFNETTYRLFRWCLSEKAYDSMGPKPKGK